MIVRAAEPEDYSEICDMLDDAFKSDLESKIVNVTTGEDTNFHKGDVRIAEVNKNVVSMMMLIRRPLRIETTIVSGAIVAPVATHPDYQGKGYCSAVMRDSIDYMKTQRFDITILWGVPWLYPHYGYSPAMMNTEIVIKTKKSNPLKETKCQFLSLAECNLEEVTHIYHSNTATRTCAEIRNPAIWEWRSGEDVKFEVVLDKRGNTVGYYAWGTDWGRPCVHEIGVLKDEVCEVIFNRLTEIAIQNELEEFYCLVHPEHPFTRFAFWHGGEMRIRSGGGAGMVRVLNLVSLLTRLEKEFERRLGYSELHKVDCTFEIMSEDESAVLDINNGRILVSEGSGKADYRLNIPLFCLNPLITGYKEIGELLNDHRVKVEGGRTASRLIEVLFPRGFPNGGNLPIIWE